MSDEVVSLFSLMDIHLSNINQTSDNDENNTARSTSDVLLPAPSGPRLAIPKFFPGNSPMKDFLAEQIANTLKAKERQKQEEELQKKEEKMKILKIGELEKQNVEGKMKQLHIRENEHHDNKEEMTNNDEQEYMIDLTSAIIQRSQQTTVGSKPIVEDKTPKKCPEPKLEQAKVIPDLPLRFDKETCLYKPWDPTLPCTTDMSYILKKKIKRGKCSTFGKVLCSRMRPVYNLYVPSINENYNSNIVRFDFRTKSPGDIYRENLMKPRMSTRFTQADIMDLI